MLAMTGVPDVTVANDALVSAGGVKWLHKSHSLSNFLTPKSAKELKDCEIQLKDTINRIITEIHDRIDPFLIEIKIKDEETRFFQLNQELNEILKNIVEVSTKQQEHLIIMQLLNSTLEFFQSKFSTNFSSFYDEKIIKNFESFDEKKEKNSEKKYQSRANEIQWVLSNIRNHLYYKLENLYSLSVQTIQTLFSMDNIDKIKISHANILHLISASRTLVDCLMKIYSLFFTYAFLRFNLFSTLPPLTPSPRAVPSRSPRSVETRSPRSITPRSPRVNVTNIATKSLSLVFFISFYFFGFYSIFSSHFLGLFENGRKGGQLLELANIRTRES